MYTNQKDQQEIYERLNYIDQKAKEQSLSSPPRPSNYKRDFRKDDKPQEPAFETGQVEDILVLQTVSLKPLNYRIKHQGIRQIGNTWEWNI